MNKVNFLLEHDQRLGDLMIDRGLINDTQRSEIAKKVAEVKNMLLFQL